MLKSAVVFAVFFVLVLCHTNKVLAKQPKVKHKTIVTKQVQKKKKAAKKIVQEEYSPKKIEIPKTKPNPYGEASAARVAQ